MPCRSPIRRRTPDAVATERWQAWRRELLERLVSELGEGYAPDHS